MDERIPVDLIDPAPDNPRKKLGDLSELVASIRAQGVLQAVSVEPMPNGRYMLVAGHRRLAAAKKAGLVDVPATRADRKTDVDRFASMVVENIQRRTLTGLERALAYQKMIDDYGLTQTEVARRVGLTPSTISNTLQLLKPPAQREAERRERYRLRDEGQVVRGRPVDDSPGEILRRLRGVSMADPPEEEPRQTRPSAIVRRPDPETPISETTVTELLTEALERAKARRGDRRGAASGREFSIVVTLLEDAITRHNKGVYMERGVFAITDAERIPPADG